MAIADARGDGRPDFAYKARVLYADAIQPAATSYEGGQITITGIGFCAGNEVLVNGVAAAVSKLDGVDDCGGGAGGERVPDEAVGGS